jgi:hypothetical protein
MIKQNNRKKYSDLRKQYPYFIYESFDWQDTGGSIQIHFDFNLAGSFHFHPVIRVLKRDFLATSLFHDHGLDTILFNLGMIELISYWKAACPPKVIIKPFHLDISFAEWWKKLFFKGLGEFFYLNGLQPRSDDFLEIITETDRPPVKLQRSFTDGYIVPVGGGKDSALSLEVLRGKQMHPMVINPLPPMFETIGRAGMTAGDTVIIERDIDPLLLDLNDRGFLNGHTPFSALVAMMGVLAAALTGYRNIALSNESSANEATVAATGVNHQYSKSWEFENDFRWYAGQYLSEDIRYFSLLRPLNELRIASLFATMPQYFNAVKSCNVAGADNTWCGQCPKCLFAFIILSPFIDEQTLTLMFGKNMLGDRQLTGILDQLTGFTAEKPFDCVGTIGETRAALDMLVQRYHERSMPALLEHYRTRKRGQEMNKVDVSGMLQAFNTEHFLNREEENRLRSLLHD